MTEVTIIIPNYNGKKLLENCIKTAFPAAYPEFKRLHRLSGNRGRASEQRQRTLPYTPWLPDGWGVLPVRV